MDKLVIRGGNPLVGTLNVSGSKNAALPLMAAAILAPGKTVLTGIPNLRDIRTFSQVIEVTGAKVSFDASAGRLEIDATEITNIHAPYKLVKKMRASFYMLGALLGRCGKARVSLPGGCAWGPRPVDLHIEGLKALGAEIELDGGDVVAETENNRLAGGTFHLKPSSVGATVNIMLGGVMASGKTRIENAAAEPDIVVLGEMLIKMGAKIEGLGTHTIDIIGVDVLAAVEFENCPDRIELGTFMIAAAMAGKPGDKVKITNAYTNHLGEAFIDAFEKTGAKMEAENGVMLITAPEKIRPVSIDTGIYPGFPTDLQAQWTVMMSQADGNSRVREQIYRDRFKHIPELSRMGMKAVVRDNEAAIEGNVKLKGAAVMSTDLRAGVSLVLAAMVAEGETEVLRVYHLDRGYDDIEGKFSSVGIDIRREKYVEFE